MRVDLPHVNFAGKVPERAARPARVRAVPVAGVPDEAPGADPACEFAGALLAARQLDPISYQTRPLVRRVPAVLRALKVTSIAEARELLARRAGLLDTALNALLIGATEFFRDAEVFEELRRHVIPALGSVPPLPAVAEPLPVAGVPAAPVAEPVLPGDSSRKQPVTVMLPLWRASGCACDAPGVGLVCDPCA